MGSNLVQTYITSLVHLSFKVDPFSGGAWYERKQQKSSKLFPFENMTESALDDFISTQRKKKKHQKF